MEFDLLIRVLAAGICGGIIGYERRNRLKEAGIRTHFVVAAGGALMMILSKYSFYDQLAVDKISLDPSRIAAQVVSGVGFLGAGVIFMQRQTIKGLTTAAGIWTTAGMGMAIGAGMYLLGAGVTVLIVIAQVLLHGRFEWLRSPKTEQLALRVDKSPGVLDRVQELMEQRHIEVVSFQVEKEGQREDELLLDLTLRLPGGYKHERLLTLIEEEPAIRSVELQ
ncbi:methyltransferase [Paenibacillus sp. J31TS4]|uniref:MgtC/SapB family protein n=1 Tax=Paenibacillus sp. J31TS4 TaxID=2807195 RepID=UPI001B20F9FE|nr:MgtC/SapB family protein [Paenibacillus sp. J31TS4]GIP37180.1 methyltransferase [Paenibacillus sp. J31TS4]